MRKVGKSKLWKFPKKSLMVRPCFLPNLQTNKFEFTPQERQTYRKPTSIRHTKVCSGWGALIPLSGSPLLWSCELWESWLPFSFKFKFNFQHFHTFSRHPEEDEQEKTQQAQQLGRKIWNSRIFVQFQFVSRISFNSSFKTTRRNLITWKIHKRWREKGREQLSNIDI